MIFRATQRQKPTTEELAAQIKQRAEAQARLAAAQAAAAASAAAGKKGDDGHALSKQDIEEMIKEYAPGETFDPEVQDMLLEIADDFVDNVLEHSARLAKHRGSETLEPQDVLLHLERHWDIHIPGYGGEEVRQFPEKELGVHARRMAAVRRSVAQANAAQMEQQKQARLAAERAAKAKGGDAAGDGD